jgi:hypothetical protein
MTGKKEGISWSLTSSSSLLISSASLRWFTVTRVLWAERASLVSVRVEDRLPSRGEEKREEGGRGLRFGESPMGLFTV